ncbi:MAG: hypothetical protein GTO03_07500 [Planctomycetales bacterium]|nr:hypothetical protein [Planctomycetales bacterium]
MSLFDNSLYRWRETYFVFHQQDHRPTTAEFQAALQKLDQKLELEELKGDENDKFLTATVIAPDAYAAIDINFVEGEEVAEQLETLSAELKEGAANDAERALIRRLADCDARLDLLHFELMVDLGEEEDDFLTGFDPAALLAVMEALADLCQGIGVDPAAATVM